MTKRELLKQARHVLGPDAIVEIEFRGHLCWTARAYTKAHGVVCGGISRDRAVERVDNMLAELDTAGWRWERS